MPSPAVRTDRTDCPRCKERGVTARVILARDTPPLDYLRDSAGTYAVRHLASGAWAARPYLPGDVLEPAEHRHRVHACGEEHPP